MKKIMKKITKTAKKPVAKKPAAKKPAAKKPAAKKPAARKPVFKKAPVQVKAAVKTPVILQRSKGGETLTGSELADIAASLSEMKIDIAKNVEDKRTLDLMEPEVGDSIDQATQSLDKEILFELSDNERKILRDIDAALRKMEIGTYGLCEHCKQPIHKKRIKALPSARYCMTCQSGSEKGGA
jgi:DnaK suppressor protein